MTFTEFKTLKIGDRVSLPDINKKGYFISTEVLSIDRFFKKITILLGGDKGFSYRYVSVRPKEPVSFCCGTHGFNKFLIV